MLDTLWYVDVLRDGPETDEVLRFIATRKTAVYFHALVGAELFMGTRNASEADSVRRRVVDRFKPSHVIVPDATDLFTAGESLAMLRRQFGPHPEHTQRSFWNDVLIAVSCRRRGAVLVSRDGDHARIAQVVKHAFVTTLDAT